MRAIFTNADLRDLSRAMVFVLMLVGVPCDLGLTIVHSHERPQITLNTCQALDSYDRSVNLGLALPVMETTQDRLLDLGFQSHEMPEPVMKRPIVPDTPPPELFL